MRYIVCRKAVIPAIVRELRRAADMDPPPFDASSLLRSCVAVDVLIKPAGKWARIAAKAAVGVLRAALLDIRTVGVAVTALARVGARDHVSPVRPDAVREGADGADVQIVAAERNRATAELLPVRVAGHVAEPHRRRPRERGRRARRRVGVDRRHRALVRAVAERPGRAEALVVPAVPPEC